jgi:deoxyribonuclease-4
MKFFVGPAGNCLSASPAGTLGSFNRLVELGLNAQEVEFVHSVFLKPEGALEVGGWAKDRGLRLSIHAPYYINLCTHELPKLEASKKRIADSLSRAQDMGARGAVAVHPGFFMKRPPQDCMDAVVEAALELASAYPKANLGFETTGKHSAFGSFEETLEVCTRVKRKNCVPVIDFAHLYARNGGIIDFGAVLDRLLTGGHTNVYAHFSGIEFTQAGEKNHIPLSSNSPSFPDLVKAFKARSSKFNEVNLVCESPLMENDAVVMKKELEKAGLWE